MWNFGFWKRKKQTTQTQLISKVELIKETPWKLVFPKKFLEELKEFLFSNTPNENGCYLLTKTYRTQKQSVILITNLIKPTKKSWKRFSEGALEPTSSYINQSVIQAEATDSGLTFVHTHPNSFHPPGFSFIDEETNSKLFANLSQILPNQPLGSLVFSRGGIHGIIFEKGITHPISKIEISGHIISKLNDSTNITHSQKIEPKFDRQFKAIGFKSQNKLQEMTISIVGVGGTGSAVAAQLARMGVKKLQFFDHDVITESNVPRVYGSKDTDCGRPKVNVLKDHIESFSNTLVETFQVDITKAEILENLLDSDVVFACTDNLSSRAILNDVAIKYFIPLIDVGCKIDVNKKNEIEKAIVKVQVVTPDDACLWCSEALDGKQIMQESLSTTEKQKLAKEGYYTSIEKQPSIVSITTRAASMGVDKLLGLIGVFGNDYCSRTQVEIKDGFMIEDNPKIKPNCVCQKRKRFVNGQKGGDD